VTRLLSGHHAFADIVFLAIAVLLLATLKEFTLAGCFSFYTLAGVFGAVRQAIFHREKEEEPIF
jgi:hypothetical protein